MSEFAVITQNDESKWDDIKGELYHYPNIYSSILTPRCKVIYYKGQIKNKDFTHSRLSNSPHYFGIGVIGDSIINPDSYKKDRYCEILDYKEFEEAVPNKDGDYLEEIPESKRKNYWRFGVREISESVYRRIVSKAKFKEKPYLISLPKLHQVLESTHRVEGEIKYRYSAYYERNPYYRSKAIELHGITCVGCGFNFEKKYGNLGEGYIHVHHNKPISESGPTRIDPSKDLSVVCPNCHAMIHRPDDRTLTIEELKEIIRNPK